jgi:uncharacterized protein (DUF2141 family)
MIKKYISLYIILILIYACATVQSPTGGEKDKKAPILYESNPKDQSTNFKGQEMKLFFNEWMKLEQLNKELIITPREDIKYEATLKKQELIIEFEEPLKDSTTYTFNFRKALKDITEDNLWENPVIAFSTGNYLDSLKVEGTITKLMKQESAESYVVGLYDAKSDTANLRQGKPVYFTTTDKTGYFKMQNIKAGKYLLYTFKDQNDNLINNSQSEPFGFYSDTLNLFDSIPTLSISTYQRNEDTLNLKKYSPVGKDFIVQYNKGLSYYNIINPKDSNQYIYANDVEQSKYIKIYKENFPNIEYEKDSVELFLKVTDSTTQNRFDTVYFKIRESRIKNETIKITNKPNGKITSGGQEFKYNLSKPVQKINYDSIQLRIDTIPIKAYAKDEISFNFNRKEITINTIINQEQITSIIDSLKSVSDSIKKSRETISNKLDSTNNISDTTNTKKGIDNDLTGSNRNRQALQNRNTNDEQRVNQVSRPTGLSALANPSNQSSSSYTLQIYIGKGAFIGIESDSTDKVSTTLSFKKIEDYGIIKGKVKDLKSNFIIELLSEKYEVVDTLINAHEYKFNYVQPGKYRLRLIEDSNANNQWDPGNPFTLEPAEKIYYYDELLTVKANWEIIDKNFDFSVDKDVDGSEENGDL